MIDVDQYDALAIPGGFEEYGFYKEAYHEKTLNLIRSFHSQHKPIASVCVAAFPLAKSAILKNRKATKKLMQLRYLDFTEYFNKIQNLRYRSDKPGKYI